MSATKDLTPFIEGIKEFGLQTLNTSIKTEDGEVYTDMSIIPPTMNNYFKYSRSINELSDITKAHPFNFFTKINEESTGLIKPILENLISGKQSEEPQNTKEVFAKEKKLSKEEKEKILSEQVDEMFNAIMANKKSEELLKEHVFYFVRLHTGTKDPAGVDFNAVASEFFYDNAEYIDVFIQITKKVLSAFLG